MERPPQDEINRIMEEMEREATPAEREELNRILGSMGMYNAQQDLDDNPNIIRGEE